MKSSLLFISFKYCDKYSAYKKQIKLTLYKYILYKCVRPKPNY